MHFWAFIGSLLLASGVAMGAYGAHGLRAIVDVPRSIEAFEYAVWVIMGANIGTTITGQLIAIDITALAPVIAFVGVALIAFFKSKKLDAIGGIIAGTGRGDDIDCASGFQG